MGVNGAGKTTTFNMITGSIKPTKGEILINKKNLFDGGLTWSNKLIGFWPQSNTLFDNMTG